jgi:hypothetical protein
MREKSRVQYRNVMDVFYHSFCQCQSTSRFMFHVADSLFCSADMYG